MKKYTYNKRKETLKKYIRQTGSGVKKRLKDSLRERKGDREIFKQILYN